MNNDFFVYLNQIFICIFIFVILICIFFSPTLCNTNQISNAISQENNNNKFLWPVQGYNKITSYFGKRTAPTNGASTYHSGIDIGAPTGANILSINSGKVTFLGFGGARRIYSYNKT